MLLAGNSIEIVLEILFLVLRNRDSEFGTQKLTGRSYITTDALIIAKRIKLMNKHEFVRVVLDKNSDTFVINVSALVVPMSIISI